MRCTISRVTLFVGFLVLLPSLLSSSAFDSAANAQPAKLSSASAGGWSILTTGELAPPGNKFGTHVTKSALVPKAVVISEIFHPNKDNKKPSLVKKMETKIFEGTEQTLSGHRVKVLEATWKMHPHYREGYQWVSFSIVDLATGKTRNEQFFEGNSLILGTDEYSVKIFPESPTTKSRTFVTLKKR